MSKRPVAPGSHSPGAARDRALGVIVVGLCAFAGGLWALWTVQSPGESGGGRHAWLYTWLDTRFGADGQAWAMMAIGVLLTFGGLVWWNRERKT